MHHSFKLEVIFKKSLNKKTNHPLLFIHGAAGGAWYFENFLNYFADKGYDSYALSLRGHGKSEGHDLIHTFSLNDYVNDVRSVVQSFQDKPILIGHSMGGAITQAYLGLYQEDLEMAILLSSAQAGGISPDSPLGLFFSDARSFIRDLRAKHPEDKITLDDVLNLTVFGNRFKEEELKQIKKMLVKESSLVKKDLLSPFMDGKTKMTTKVVVIGSKDDHIIGLKELEMTAYYFNTKPIILSNLCHFLTIDPNWMVAADAILTALNHHKMT